MAELNGPGWKEDMKGAEPKPSDESLSSDSEGTNLADPLSDRALWELVKNDPVTMMLLSGQARTVHEAEKRFLNENVEAISQMVLELVESNLSDEEFGRHPLILLIRGHGSRRWEDSLL